MGGFWVFIVGRSSGFGFLLQSNVDPFVTPAAHVRRRRNPGFQGFRGEYRKCARVVPAPGFSERQRSRAWVWILQNVSLGLLGLIEQLAASLEYS